jgi:PAS domain S-box-containing protein
LLFKHAPTAPQPAGTPSLKHDLALEIAGRPWLVHVRARPELAKWVEARTPLQTWTVGGIASFLLFGLLHARRRVAAEQRSRRDRFLVDVNAVFDSAADEPAVLDQLAEVAVPRFADWCFLATSSEEGVPSHIAVASSDTEEARRVRDQLTRRSASSLLRARATPELVERRSSVALTSLGLPPEDIALARELGFVSMIRLPLAVRGKIGGTITFVTTDSRRRYGASDRATAEEVAERVAFKLENRRLLRSVQAANAERELILDSTAEGIYGVDTQGRATFVNPAAARMVGREIEEITGKQQHELLHHSHADGTPYSSDGCPIYASLRDGVTHRSEADVFWHKNGTSFPVEYASTPIFQGGKVTGTASHLMARPRDGRHPVAFANGRKLSHHPAKFSATARRKPLHGMTPLQKVGATAALSQMFSDRKLHPDDWHSHCYAPARPTFHGQNQLFALELHMMSVNRNFVKSGNTPVHTGNTPVRTGNTPV